MAKLRGRFITFEGGEGAGKSTQAAYLAEELENEGVSVLLVREPGGTPLGEKIRKILKDGKGQAPCPRAETLLFLAARAQLVEKTIEPALASGKWVVSDRFCDSTLAYQGYGRGLPVDELRSMDCFARSGILPDLTILLDIDLDSGMERLDARALESGGHLDRIELEKREFHERLRRGFLELALADKERFDVINAALDRDCVRRLVWKSVSRFL